MTKSALSPAKLQQTRHEILTHIGLIEEMRRGSVTRQFLKIKLKGQKDPALAGPYALFTRNRSERRYRHGCDPQLIQCVHGAGRVVQ